MNKLKFLNNSKQAFGVNFKVRDLNIMKILKHYPITGMAISGSRSQDTTEYCILRNSICSMYCTA